MVWVGFVWLRACIIGALVSTISGLLFMQGSENLLFSAGTASYKYEHNR
jgi:hypothetical protein